MTKLTQEAKKYIQQYHYNSQRVLAEQIYVLFGIKITHAAVGRYKKKYLKTLEKPKVQVQKIPVQTKIPNIDTFMDQLVMSNSFSANRLKEKLNVQGKNRQINRDRVIRIIQDTLNCLQE